jgi:hypothetical protein
MKSREKMLLIAVVAVLALFGLKLGFDTVSQWFADSEKTIAERTSEKDKAEAKIRAGNLAERHMRDWQARSLPTNAEKGRADYLSWLTSLASKHLKNASVTRESVLPDKSAGKDKSKLLDEKYRFHIKATSDLQLAGVTKFLYDFYSANHLQVIRNLSLIPDKEKLTVSIDIEAMMMPAAQRKDDLLKEGLSKLALGDSSAYQKIIGGRDLFEPYKEKEVVAKGPPPQAPFDIAKYTKVTAIKSVDGEPEMDVNVRTTGQQFRSLKVGDEFQVGDNSNKSTYKVLEIGAYDAVLLVDGKDRKHIKLGDVLRDAVPVSETPTGL